MKLLLAILALTAATSVAEEELLAKDPLPPQPSAPAPDAEEKKNAPTKTKEHTIEAKPFKLSMELNGILVPTQTQTYKLSPQQWRSFPIQAISPHGTVIKAGEPLIELDSEAIDRKIIELTDNVKSQEIQLAIANRELTELQQKNTLARATAKHRLEHAEADLAYYQSTGQPARKESLAQSQQQAEDSLSYQQEELDQLLKMYREDDLTEETEEIILVRQQARVRDAKNNLAERKRRNAHTLEVVLPRETLSHQEKVEKARIDYATAKLNLERQYELKKLSIAKLERQLARVQTELAETQEDRQLFNQVAAFDGHLLYGEFKDGQWKKGKTSEFLRVGGHVPDQKTVLTLAATDSPLALHALMDSEEVAALKTSLQESGEQAPEVTISPYPNLNGKHLIILGEKSAEPFHFPGQEDQAELIFYQAEDAITIPNKAIETREDGSSYVKVKLSEGEPEERKVELGRKNENVSEILSGLEVGQVILK